MRKGLFDLLLIDDAGVIGWDGIADLVDGVAVEVTPDGIVNEGAILGLMGLAARRDDSVGAVGVSTDIDTGHELAGIAEGRFGFVDVHDGSEFVESQHFPGAAVVLSGPTAIEDVAVSEVAIFGSGRTKSLPGLELIAGSAKSDDAGDLGVFCETGGCGGAVGSA